MQLSDGTLQPYSLTIGKFLDHAAKWHPQVEVVARRFDGSISRIGYADLNARARRISTVLKRLGVNGGDRVATLAWNTQAHMEAWYAIMGMGAVCHTLNPRLPAIQLADMTDQSGAQLLIVSADLVPLAQELVALAREPVQLLVIDGPARPPAPTGAPVDLLEALLDDCQQADAWDFAGEFAACGLCFTSGTTGAPKGVTYTHRGNYLHTLRQLQADVLGLTARDTVMAVVPMFHANAWGLPFSAPASGARLVLPGRMTDGASLAELIAVEQVTMAAAVPTVWLELINHLENTGATLPSLRRIMVGGAPMPHSLMDKIESHGIEVQTTWGMTELSPLGTAMPPGDPDREAGVAGRPAVGLDLQLTDADGAPLPRQRDAEGHLWVRGPSVVERYLGEQVPATRDGWFATGDLAVIDGDGRMMITGRSKDLIKSGGEWINPAEIEALVSALPEVAMAAVIGREDDKWGERPILIAQLKDGVQLEGQALLDVLRGAIANWWLPDEVFIVSEMPLAATGKLDKLRLRHEFSSMPKP